MKSAPHRRNWTSVFGRASRKQRRAEAKTGLHVLHLEDRVTPALFAITQDDIVAQDLGYGPSAITESSGAFVSTLEANVVHTQWNQVVTATSGTLFTIDWQFSTPKTLSQRFVDAVTVGEPVTWTVNSTAFGTQTYSGDWRFSTGAGDMAARFAGSGTSFSNDDGIWGAGNGLINSDLGTTPNGIQANIQWGHGNFDTSDAADSLYQNGAITTPNLPAGFKNLMYVVGGTIAPTLNAGVLTIDDIDATGKDNQLTASISGANLVITDANEQFTSAPAGGALSNGNKTLTIPLASLPNGLIVNTAGGSDTYTADFTGGNLPTTTFNGGAGTTDKLSILGGSTTTQTFNFANENDGSVVLAGAIAGTINYTGLEPVTSTIDATNVILNYSGASETITVTASGAQTKVDSTAGEVVTFDNPTALLEINAGDGTDTATVTSFGPGFNAALDIDGEAGTGDVVNLNAAVTYAANKNLTVAAETISVTAAQVLSGTGVINLTAGQNIVVSANLSGGTGGTTLVANGTAALNTVGVFIQGGAVVSASGAGAVSVTGTGGGGAAGNNFGFRITGAGSKVTSGGGNVSVTGTGGAGNGPGNVGSIVDLNAMVTSGGNGTVTVLGTGGPGTGTSYHGVLMNDAGVITSGGTGKVDVTGVAKGSSDGRGVWVFINSQITSGGGDVSVTGTGGSGGNSNYGINLNNNNAGLPSITSGGSGTVTVTGTGGSAGNNNFGITLDLVTSISSGGSGKVTVVGTGGGNAGSSGNNHGVNLLVPGATITSGGGNVTVTGTGGTSGGQNFGINMPNNALITSDGAGSVVVIANAGTQLGAATQRHGLFIRGGSDITSGGAGTVTVTGTGGLNGAGSFGVNMLDTGTTITSGGGNVQVTGNGGTGGTFNLGVVVDLGSDILAAGTGTVSVNGNGGSGAASTGIFVQGNGSTITSSGGAVSVTGAGGSGNFGIQLVSNGQITSGTNAAITVTTDSIDIPAGSAINSGTGTATFRPRTAGTNVDLGGADVLSGSPLTLGLTDPELDRVTASTILIGSAATGNIDVSSPITINTNLNLAAAGGKTATLGAGIDAGTGNVTFTGAMGATSVVSNSTWLQSTATDAPTGGGDWVPARTTPPATATFTIPVTIATGAGIDATDVTDIGGGAQPIRSFADTFYYYTTFTLPSATGITANIRLSVDNSAQVFINGQEVAREINVDGGNFTGPNYPRFRINPDGTIDNVLRFDSTFNFTNWIAGTNELVVAVRNTSGGDSGGLVFRMDITVDQAITIVPSGSGVDATANKTTLGTDNTLAIAIDGTAVDTQYQQLNVAGGIDITSSKLLLSGSYTPVSGDSFVIVNNDGVDPVVGTFAGLLEGAKVSFAGGDLYITYQGGDGNDVVLNYDPVVNGTAGADTLVVTPTATGYTYQLNADPIVSVVGTAALTFNGLDGDDKLVAVLNTFSLPNIAYNGGNQDTPATAGNNAVFGDVLVVNDTNKTHTATYLGDGTAGPADNDGTVAILGQGTITFTQLEPVDLIGLAVANVTFANADDLITVANGKDSGTNTLDALVVSGVSGGVAFEQVHLRNNALVNINTVTGGTDGDDTVVIAGASNGHGNVNFDLDTGAGADLVAITGAASFAGSATITTGDLTVAGALSAGVTVSGTASFSILIAAAVSAASGAVALSADQDVTVTGAGSISAGTTVSIMADVTADADAIGATVSIDGTITAATMAGIVTGDDADTVAISAAINGTAASVTTAGAADDITVSTSGTAPLTLDGAALGDTYTVNVGTLNATVNVADSGASVTDTLNVNGTAAANTFEVNSTAGGIATVRVDATQVVTYTAAIEAMNLDGGDAGDTFNVFFAQGGASFLPALVNIADTGASAGDVANLSGTNGDDVFDVNFTATRTTSSGTSTVTYANGNLETLNVFSKDGLDLVRAKAVSLTGGGPAVNLDGGSPSAPIALTGDILILDITGQTGLNTANIKTPDGSVSSTSHNLLSWVDFETIPTAAGLGGTFDFGTATSPVQAGPYAVPSPASYWTRVANTDTFASKGSYGWNTVVNGYDRGNASPSPAGTTFQNLLRDGNWFGPANVSRTFSVAAVAAGSYQVSVTLGDTAVVMDNVYVTIEGSAQFLVPTAFQNQFITVTGIGSDTNADGKLDISFVDKGGTHSYWHVNAVDVRPLDLVSPVTVTRSGGAGTQVADGLSKSTYFAEGFFPNAIVTVAATGGKITSADVDAFLVGVQVLADAAGKATFELQHPTGNADVTLTASAAVVVDARGTFTQAFMLTPSQKIDFNGATTPTEAGYLGFTNTLYAGPATSGLGWLQAVQLGDRGAAAGNLFRDFAFNSAGTATRGEFNIDLPTGAAQAVTVYLGDPATARDRLQVEALTASGYVVVATEIATSKTNSITFSATPVDIGGGNFQVRLRFSDLGGSQNGWSVQGIEYRTLASQGALGISPTGAVAGNGTAVTTYTITGGPVAGLVTVTSKFGAILGTDASAVYDGFQVLLGGGGSGTFDVKSPVVAFGSLASAVGLVTVNGSHAGGFTQPYTGAKVSYDFGPLAAPVAAGFKGLPVATKATAQNGVGFTTAGPGEFDRNPASFPAVTATGNADLFRDGATGTGTGGFRVLVQAGATNVPVRVYAYDANSARGTLTVTAEGGTPANTKALPTSLTVPAVFDVVGSDTNGDGFLDISIAGFSTWVMNGVEVG